MMPSVGPSSSWRRRQSRMIRMSPLRLSSTTGAPKVAETYCPVLCPRAGWVMKTSPAVLITTASSAATPAPQANASTRLTRGSGSSRSISSTQPTRNGTGSRANGSAMRNGATLCPAAPTLCRASVPRTTIPQPIAAMMPRISPVRGLPGGRPSITARGSKPGIGVAMAGSVPGTAAISGSRLARVPATAGAVREVGESGDRVSIAWPRGGPAQATRGADPAVSSPSDTQAANTQAAGSATLEWTEADQRAVDLIRVLAMDAVQKAGSGHPGTAMSLAPAAYLLYQRVLRHDPADPNWLGRDRFVLSCGHSSLTLYIQLYLSGYGLSLDDLKRYREWGSLTPGHPEHGLTPGVETTTGPLGQGLANAVGMAMAARRERGLLDPDAPEGTSPFDHHVYAFVSDGDIEEGISHEASSLAAHQDLGNLVVLYDDNQISIEIGRASCRERV